MSRRNYRFVVLAMVLSWLSACSAPATALATPRTPPTQVPSTGTPISLKSLTPQITVNDQNAMNGTVSIASVVAHEQGWLAINAEKNGAPGIVIGYSPVKPGVNRNVVVIIDLLHATPRLWAVLHVDKGQVGTWEFPGPDVPVQVAGNMVMSAFNVTLPVSGTPPA